MTWLEYIIKAFENLGGVASYSQLYNEIILIRDENFSNSWKAVVRATIERNSSDSLAYGGKNDIFYSVDGLGNGIWGLRNYEDNNNDIVKEEEDTYRVNINIKRIIRDTKIIKELKALYDNTCQICSSKIEIDKNKYYSEGHHIKPLGNPHNGPDIKENIIIVCPNCHVKFDNGAIDVSKLKINESKHHKIDYRYVKYYNDKILKKIYKNK
ncbi:HNH endonuclease [Paeniclostridium sordellii]|uniref:HNH endonuclease n=1 Tax=Paraclostridium sordellii TaxID=1505 RepID=UPI0012EDD7B4|nr:HNH endonuclease [Paeniclostridium sordellii]MVO70226.1 HNH endonuclease [Paeniclostridium sordellii]